MTTQQALFPEAARVEQRPDAPRWHVLDDQDGPAFAQTHAALVLGAFDTLAEVRAAYDDDSEWLYDTATDELYEPYTWPDSEDIPGLAVHLRALAGVDA